MNIVNRIPVMKKISDMQYLLLLRSATHVDSLAVSCSSSSSSSSSNQQQQQQQQPAAEAARIKMHLYDKDDAIKAI
jgi:hypothetical protein